MWLGCHRRRHKFTPYYLQPEGNKIYYVMVFLVIESMGFGIVVSLRSVPTRSSGRLFNFTTDHWSTVPTDALDKISRKSRAINTIRRITEFAGGKLSTGRFETRLSSRNDPFPRRSHDIPWRFSDFRPRSPRGGEENGRWMVVAKFPRVLVR